jgi:hypothetical protein
MIDELIHPVDAAKYQMIDIEQLNAKELDGYGLGQLRVDCLRSE